MEMREGKLGDEDAGQADADLAAKVGAQVTKWLLSLPPTEMEEYLVALDQWGTDGGREPNHIDRR